MKNVILIPGITGTTLVNSNSLDFDTIYSGLARYFANIEEMALDEDPRFDEDATLLVERNKVESLAYKEVIKLLPSEDFRIYIFGYDWRKSNAETAQNLLAYVNNLKNKLAAKGEDPKTTRFYFITHSMGGLVFQAYLKLLNGDYSSIAKAILTVPPFLGAADAVKSMVLGVSYLMNSKDSFRKVARTLPGMFELLPYYDGALKYTDGAPASVFNLDDWQQNIYPDKKDKNDTRSPQIFAKRINGAKDFASNSMLSLSDLPGDVKKRLLILTGQGYKTLTNISIDKAHDNLFGFGPEGEIENGDGTVPLTSSHKYVADKELLTVEVHKDILSPLRYKLFLGQHAGFLDDGRVQSIIRRFFYDDDTDEKWYEVIGGSVKRAQ